MKNRVDYIDVAKGIGIILVILGHTIEKGTIWNCIYGFHMPFFLFCSGIFYRKNRWKKQLVKILCSYFLLACVGVMLWYLFVERGNIVYIKQSIYNIIVGGAAPKYGIYPVEALWYLVTFATIILINAILSVIKNKKIIFVFSFFISAIGLMLGYKFRNRIDMLYNIDVSLALYPFYLIGTEWDKIQNNKYYKRLFGKKYSILFAFVIYCIVANLNGFVNVYKAVYGNYLCVIYISGLLGSILLLEFSKKICSNMDILKSTRMPRTILVMFGKSTLIIMGTHQIVIRIIKLIWPGCVVALEFIITSVIMFLIVIIEQKLKEASANAS